MINIIKTMVLFQCCLTLIFLTGIITAQNDQFQSYQDSISQKCLSDIEKLSDANQLLKREVESLTFKMQDLVDTNYIESQISVLEEITNRSTDQLNSELGSLRTDFNRKWIKTLSTSDSLQTKLLSLKLEVKSIENSITNLSDSLESQITELSDFIQMTQNSTNAGFKDVKNNFKTWVRYWVLTVSVILLLVIAVYVIVRLIIKSQNITINSELENTRRKLQEQAIKVDSDLIRVLEAQLSLEKQALNSGQDNHTLPLKLADEIHRMRKRLSSMDESHGVKVLGKRIETLEDTLNEMGYEIKCLEGVVFNDGMQLEATFITDESIHGEDRIITKVLRPQVNYKNKLLQAAKVEVSQGI